MLNIETKELKELDKEKDRIKIAYIKGIVKLDEFDNELKQIEYKRQVLEKQDSKQYENLNFTMDDLLLIKDKKEIEDYLHPENIIDLFVRWNHLDKTNKQKLISKYIDDIEIETLGTTIEIKKLNLRNSFYYDLIDYHLSQLIKQVANNKLFATVKGGYDFVDVRDVADGIISACEKDNKNECYILSNKYITIKDLTDLICDLQNKKIGNTSFILFLAKLVAPFFELYYNIKKETPLFTKYSLYTLSSNANFSNAKAKKELGFKNKDIKETIKDTLIWLKEKNYIK